MKKLQTTNMKHVNNKMINRPQFGLDNLIHAPVIDLASPNPSFRVEVERLKKVKPNFGNIYEYLSVRLTFDNEGKCNNAFEVICDPNTLMIAYNSIRSNAGNMVQGVDNETLDGIDASWFMSTGKSLRKESWQPKPSRRVYIPKPNGKMRPLGISSPRDKIVQQAMKMVLETILEPKFSDCSHGFRPGRGCHTALKEIRDWKGVPWIIEGDIKNYFSTINQHILEALINKHFADHRLISLYWKLVRAGYIEWEKKNPLYVDTDIGVPQGGIVSPLLSNLVLHELDSYLEEVIRKMDERNGMLKPHVTNPQYHKLTMRIKRLKSRIMDKKNRNIDWGIDLKELKKWICERRRFKSIVPNPDYIKIRYIRYADDWVIGVWGPKKAAELIKENIALLLSKLQLELSVEKTLITNTRRNKASFLGTLIKRIASDNNIILTKKNGVIRRIPTGNLWMTAPITKLVKKLADKEFLLIKGSRWIPRSIGKFTVLPIPDIIMRYNSIINGITNYYSFVDNRRQLNKIYWIIKESLRSTLASKLDLSRKVVKKLFGSNVSYNMFRKQTLGNKLISFNKIDFTRKPMLFLGDMNYNDPFKSLIQKVSTINSFGLACSSCGSTSHIEMHHLKHIKTINTKLNTFDKMLAKINRKQVPLCRKCHIEVHKGVYQGKSLKNFNMKWERIQ